MCSNRWVIIQSAPFVLFDNGIIDWVRGIMATNAVPGFDSQCVPDHQCGPLTGRLLCIIALKTLLETFPSPVVTSCKISNLTNLRRIIN